MIIALLTALWVGAASAQVPRPVGLGEVRVEDDRRIVALTIDEVEGVLAVDINIVLDSRAVTVLDFALTDLLPGFFAELHLEDVGATPQLLFVVVTLNGDEIPVEFAPRWTLPGSTLVKGERAAGAMWPGWRARDLSERSG
tara:strand:+ start:749 stop:1171 length:423 start_codon:yes stop_codon:yes gene_type:complete